MHPCHTYAISEPNLYQIYVVSKPYPAASVTKSMTN